MPHRLLAAALLLSGALASAQDLREQFGTRSQEAAVALQEGMNLVQQKQPQAALPKLRRAIELDPGFELAIYWLASAQLDLGDVEPALALYQKIHDSALRGGRVTNISVDACLNSGLVQAKIGRLDESAIWFSRAVLLDPDDAHGYHWKAYRNMAISHAKKERNLSAALCALLAYKANPAKVEPSMVEEYQQKSAGEEGGQILTFPPESRALPKRAAPGRLDPAGPVTGVEGVVTQILPDAAGRRVLAFVDQKDHYFVVDATAKATRVQAPGPILSATVAAGDLYLGIAGPPRLVKVNAATGAAAKTWPLPFEAPRSLAVVAAAGLAAFPVGGTLHTLDLESGKAAKLDFQVSVVASDPLQKSVYAYKRPDARQDSGFILVDGRPIFFQMGDTDWMQTTLLRFASAGKKLLLAGARLNAASNGQVLQVSPDGRWVGVVGGGGWRPTKEGIGGGYGTALFPSDAFETHHGYFAIDAYPRGAAISPGTGQIALVREEDARVYGLADPSTGTAPFKGPFGSACAWSADGRHLFVAAKAGGLLAFKNELTKEEEASAGKWAEELSRRGARPAAGAPARAAEPIAEFASFRISKDKAEVVKAIQRAEKEGRTTSPLEWRDHPPYVSDKELAAALAEAEKLIVQKDWGLLIFRMKEMKTKHPSHPAIDFFLSFGYHQTKQYDKALPALTAVITADQGRTTLTRHAARGLAHLKREENDPIAAAWCFAKVLTLDLADPQLVAEGEEFFKRAGLEKESKGLLDRARAAGGGKGAASSASAKLPVLPKPRSSSTLKATDLYRQSAPGIVRVQTASGSGSGVCVGDKGWILTNAHVVAGARDAIEVIPFTFQSGKLQKLEALKASLVCLSEDEDVAVLRVEKPPSSLVPLPVAERDAQPGEKVYAIGSPGLGKAILEQSITEGIVSSPARQIQGQAYVQHTAAVNPGNSGGPLMDEKGQVIGLVTLKAELENVGFAIPAKGIRAIFERHSK